jgi:hypothetical protein
MSISIDAEQIINFCLSSSTLLGFVQFIEEVPVLEAIVNVDLLPSLDLPRRRKENLLFVFG